MLLLSSFCRILRNLGQWRSLNAFGVRCVRASVADAISLSIPHQASDISDFVTVSMGICTTIPADELPEELVKQGDVALYRAKQQGRDRYMIFS
jgi:PleD family two-component response regulator